MYDVVLFGGTDEGHKIADFLSEQKVSYIVCVATEYGAELLVLKPNLPHRNRTSNISPPITAPTSGKKHIAYFIFFSFHSTLGIGIFEYIENATHIDLIIFILLSPFNFNRYSVNDLIHFIGTF